MAAKIPAHERCETPLFPFHSIPKPGFEEDKKLHAVEGVGTQRECEDDLSLTSLPSFSPLIPLSTSNTFCTTSQYVIRLNSDVFLTSRRPFHRSSGLFIFRPRRQHSFQRLLYQKLLMRKSNNSVERPSGARHTFSSTSRHWSGLPC